MAGEAEEPITIKLEKPVQAHGEVVSQLVFRTPTGEDIMAIGESMPITVDWNTGFVSPKPGPMGVMMSRLAQVPPSTIKQLSAKDFSTCAHALMGFFSPGSQAT